MSKEAMRLALDALDEFCELGAIIRPLEVRDALREALAEQPAQQEPAGWRPATFHRDNLSFNPGFPDEQTVKFWKMQGVEIEYCYTSPLLLSPGATLYTSPPSQRKPLTDEQISDIWCRVSNTDFVTVDTHEFARAIEAAHRIKGDA